MTSPNPQAPPRSANNFGMHGGHGAASVFDRQSVAGFVIERSNIQEDILANALVALTLSDTQIRRDLALVFRKDKSLSRAAKAFIEIAEKQKNFSTAAAPAKRAR